MTIIHPQLHQSQEATLTRPDYRSSLSPVSFVSLFCFASLVFSFSVTLGPDYLPGTLRYLTI